MNDETKQFLEETRQRLLIALTKCAPESTTHASLCYELCQIVIALETARSADALHNIDAIGNAQLRWMRVRYDGDDRE